ncbi:MAG: Chemotaxis protein methyltransferase [Syntrophaceae bacterium PtaU1.Bin231]|nr:MAG: Chemotaxis protein methyltransferase [Syntrophaceae bacterium PtaU1.Bin231]HOG16720.1 protein-glutamate O-methyltransferase [Syntrophales bacterium]
MNSLEMRDIDFEKISRLIYGQCGINLHEGKKELVKARLGKRLREGNFRSFADYYKFVTTEDGTDELVSMIDSISTNLTFFFREEIHFQKLRQIIAKRPAASVRDGVDRLSVWSAGCSTGEEPYSLAITLRECENGRPLDARILATDISTRVLKTATRGIYPIEKVNSLPPAILKRHFQRGCGNWNGHVRVKPEVQRMVKFMRFNLMEEAPAEFRFDVIFCRNVMIYFDKETQSLLVNRFYRCLNKGGYFFVGHSESLTGLKHSFKYVEPSVYRK